MMDDKLASVAEWMLANPMDPKFEFRPHARVDTDGDILQVYLTGECFYAKPLGNGLDLHIKQGTEDEVVGFTLWRWSKLAEAGK